MGPPVKANIMLYIHALPSLLIYKYTAVVAAMYLALGKKCELTTYIQNTTWSIVIEIRFERWHIEKLVWSH